jgi:hypothetical protein
MVERSADALQVSVSQGGRRLERRVDETHASWLDLHAAAAEAFGTRIPLERRPRSASTATAPLTPVLTANLHPRQLYGYGDPAVTRETLTAGRYRWWLHVTSNDAPDAFPYLSSDDLETWRFEGFVFPEGRAPAWCATGEGVADFWAPEMHRVCDRWWLAFSARKPNGEMAIGLAVADRPEGPWNAFERPIVESGVIDPHLVIDPDDGSPWLLWKEDSNAIWPRRLASLFAARPELAGELFPAREDRSTAEYVSVMLAAAPGIASMQEFFALQPMIEAAAEDLPAFKLRLAGLVDRLDGPARALAAEALAATETKVVARRVAPDGASLVGDARVVLVNDRLWEAHLIEGVWVAAIEGRWWIVYAANDFSTDHYGVGAAVADHPLGPFEKAAEPLVRSTADWSGPGHPSVTLDAQERPRLFLHAFFPGRTGYNVFRALLSAGLRVDGGRLQLFSIPRTTPSGS